MALIGPITPCRFTVKTQKIWLVEMFFNKSMSLFKKGMCWISLFCHYRESLGYKSGAHAVRCTVGVVILSILYFYFLRVLLPKDFAKTVRHSLTASIAWGLRQQSDLQIFTQVAESKRGKTQTTNLLLTSHLRPGARYRRSESRNDMLLMLQHQK